MVRQVQIKESDKLQPKLESMSHGRNRAVNKKVR